MIRAKQQLADHEIQSNLGVREESIKREMIQLKELIDDLKSAPSKIQAKLSQLRFEQERLLVRLEEVNVSIHIKEANLTQLPRVTDEKKAEMTARYNELMTIRSQRRKVIPGSSNEDNWLIAEADAIRLDALSAV